MRKFVLIILAAVLLAGCSNNDGEENINNSDTNNQEPNTEKTGENEAKNDESNNLTEENSDDSDDSNTDEHVEHQRGLKMDEPGIVEDNQEQKYDVTLNSVEYVEIVGGLDSEGETHAVVNMTVKNLRDESFDAKNIFSPSFGPEGELQSSLNTVLMDEDLTDEDDIEQDLLEGEVDSGESVSGDHVFVVDEKTDKYIFAMGGKGDQIITYAQWEVPESEID